MNFHTFGDKNDPAVVLIHGVLTPWQVWGYQIDRLKADHYVIVPALDAHEEEKQSEYISVKDEAEKIESWCTENLNGRVYALCGISMGGAIAAEILRRGKLVIEKAVIDGAPLIPQRGLLPAAMNIYTKMAVGQYKTILKKSRERDEKTLESCKKAFLPEKYLEAYLKIADNMSESSLENILTTVFGYDFFKSPACSAGKVMYIHGTKGNEIISGKGAGEFKKLFPETEVTVCEGCGHCEYAIWKPEKWAEITDNFLKK